MVVSYRTERLNDRTLSECLGKEVVTNAVTSFSDGRFQSLGSGFCYVGYLGRDSVGVVLVSPRVLARDPAGRAEINGVPFNHTGDVDPTKLPRIHPNYVNQWGLALLVEQ